MLLDICLTNSTIRLYFDKLEYTHLGMLHASHSLENSSMLQVNIYQTYTASHNWSDSLSVWVVQAPVSSCYSLADVGLATRWKKDEICGNASWALPQKHGAREWSKLFEHSGTISMGANLLCGSTPFCYLDTSAHGSSHGGQWDFFQNRIFFWDTSIL